MEAHNSAGRRADKQDAALKSCIGKQVTILFCSGRHVSYILLAVERYTLILQSNQAGVVIAPKSAIELVMTGQPIEAGKGT